MKYENQQEQGQMKVTLSVINDGVLSEVVELSAEEFTSVNQALHWFHGFTASQRLYLIVHFNSQDYREKLRSYLIQFAKDGVGFRKHMSGVATDMNRLLLNFLSAIRMYVDHTKYSLNKQYGKGSSEFNRFCVAYEEARNESPSFNFLCVLREYAQHCGLPIDSTKVTDKPSESPQTGRVYEFELALSRDTLLEDYNRWGDARKWLKTQPDRIDIQMHMEEGLKSLERINSTHIVIQSPRIITGALYIKRLVELLKATNGTPALVATYPDGRKQVYELPMLDIGLVLDTMFPEGTDNK